MKKMLLICLALVSCTASAGEKLMLSAQGSYEVGDLAKLSDMAMLMYLDKPCGLPIVNAGAMRAAVVNYAKPTEGCWGKAITGDVLLVDPISGSQNLGPDRYMFIGESDGSGNVRIVSAPAKPTNRYQP
ncbi:hypothetical protein [Metapseudomonas otitidis]|uniref:hypothetical protein n=1 Tax=Metapseudomonas otitidis TaxID=319939 RepID=UPI001AAFD1C3|nr:hypothetical protein [Pseudomonas otitidis]MBO2926645.1 hypothetical protein [Pseudomonas otitidis]